MKNTHYVKKPVIIEAIIWTGSNLQEIDNFFSTKKESPREYGFISNDESMFIKTMEGKMIASKGDYIIKGVKGEFYPCKPDIFKLSYDKVL